MDVRTRCRGTQLGGGAASRTRETLASSMHTESWERCPWVAYTLPSVMVLLGNQAGEP